MVACRQSCLTVMVLLSWFIGTFAGSACSSFRVDGTLNQDLIEGNDFRKRPSKQYHYNSRSVFSSNRGGYYMYIFYAHDTNGNSGWRVSNEVSTSSKVYIMARDDAMLLEDVTSQWIEVGINSNESLRVQCQDTNIKTCTINIHDGYGYHTYYKQLPGGSAVVCHNRPAYQKDGGRRGIFDKWGLRKYLYYAIQGSGWRGWVIGDELCSDDNNTHYVAAEDHALWPIDVANTWERRKRSWSDDWTFLHDIKVECYGLDHPCSTWRGAAIGLICGISAVISSLIVTLVVCDMRIKKSAVANKPDDRVVAEEEAGFTGDSVEMSTIAAEVDRSRHMTVQDICNDTPPPPYCEIIA